MIRHINRRIRELKVTNVVSILADPDDPLLPEGQSNQVSLAHEQMLKPGGEIIMIDLHKKELLVGPPMQMKIAREALIKQMERNGFGLTKDHTFLRDQYFLVFVSK